MLTQRRMGRWLIALAGTACAEGPPDFAPLRLSASPPTAENAATVPLRRFARRDEAGATRYTVVEVSSADIAFSGQALAPLEGGQIPPEHTRGGVITRLYDALSEARDGAAHTCGPDPQQEILLVIDAATPYAVARQVAHTAGMAGYGTLFLMVADPEAPPHTAPTAAGSHRGHHIQVGGDGSLTLQGESVEANALADLLRDQARPTCVGLAPRNEQASWASVIGAMDALSGIEGTITVLTGMSEVDEEHSTTPPRAPGSARELAADAPVAVLRSPMQLASEPSDPEFSAPRHQHPGTCPDFSLPGGVGRDLSQGIGATQP